MLLASGFGAAWMIFDLLNAEVILADIGSCAVVIVLPAAHLLVFVI